MLLFDKPRYRLDNFIWSDSWRFFQRSETRIERRNYTNERERFRGANGLLVSCFFSKSSLWPASGLGNETPRSPGWTTNRNWKGRSTYPVTWPSLPRYRWFIGGSRLGSILQLISEPLPRNDVSKTCREFEDVAMFLDSDLTRSFIFDPFCEKSIFFNGTDNGNFPLEISTRSTNFFPYFWDIFLLNIFLFVIIVLIISSFLVLAIFSILFLL